MSNQACLFAEDAPAPYDPFAEGVGPAANSVQIAGAAYQVPAFWLCCFDQADIAIVESEEGDIPALVSDIAQVRRRLVEREGAVTNLFPAHAPAWGEFRQAIEAAGRKFLKVDAYEIWMLYGNEGEFAGLLRKALNWFESESRDDFGALLALAGIECYDENTKSFPAGADDPERFLYGWLEE